MKSLLNPHPAPQKTDQKTLRPSGRSQLLRRRGAKGGSVIVTSHGKPVAQITPVTEDEPAAD